MPEKTTQTNGVLVGSIIGLMALLILLLAVLFHLEGEATRAVLRQHLSEGAAAKACDCHCHCDACRCGGHEPKPLQPPKPHGDAGPSGSKPPASGAAAP